MKKNEGKITKLTKGEVCVYDFGAVKLHAYRTNNPMNDYVLLLEKAKQGVLIETPCFHDNCTEIANYIERQNIYPAGILTSYHITGKDFLKDVKRYGTRESEDYRQGKCRGMIEHFAGLFGAAFDHSITEITDYISGKSIKIAGIKLNIIRTSEAFDIEIPEIKTMYVHMLGHDGHSFVSGIAAAEAEIAKLSAIAKKNYDLILTSHHAPEDMDDVREKIEYLRKLLHTAHACRTADSFKSVLLQEYPKLAGENFLDMTINAIYGKKAS